jgi:hypothetical protein
MYYGAPPRCIEVTYSMAEPHCNTETLCSYTKRRHANLRLITHPLWCALST